MRRLGLLCTLWLFPTALWAEAQAPVRYHFAPEEAQSLFASSNEACLREQYETCVQGYEQLVQAGWGGADLSYNLGTAWLRQNRLGPAVLNLERALRLDPDDADARANLETAKRLRLDRLVGAPEETAGEEPLLSRIAARTRGGPWSVAFLALWLSAAALLFARSLLRSPGLRLGALLLGLAALAAALPAAAVTAAHLYRDQGAPEAVVVAAAAPVREGPRQDLKSSFEVHEGLKLRLLDREGGFVRVRLANGLQGWVDEAAVTPIDG